MMMQMMTTNTALWVADSFIDSLLSLSLGLYDFHRTRYQFWCHELLGTEFATVSSERPRLVGSCSVVGHHRTP